MLEGQTWGVRDVVLARGADLAQAQGTAGDGVGWPRGGQQEARWPLMTPLLTTTPSVPCSTFILPQRAPRTPKKQLRRTHREPAPGWTERPLPARTLRSGAICTAQHDGVGSWGPGRPGPLNKRRRSNEEVVKGGGFQKRPKR